MKKKKCDYISKENILFIIKECGCWSEKLANAITKFPNEDVIPVEWIEEWKKERCGYKHTVCQSLLNDWDKEKSYE